MNVFDTIRQRRSIGKMTEQQPTCAQIETILTAATHAPNHRKVEPWRFFVLAGEARAALGDVMATSLAQKLESVGEPGEPFDNKKLALIQKERTKLLRSPVVIVVIAERPQQSNVLDVENIAAVAAATQNMLLTAEELGLASMWRTGDSAYDPRVKQWLDLEPDDHIIAFLYLGYPAIPRLERQPTPIEEKTTWLGWS